MRRAALAAAGLAVVLSTAACTGQGNAPVAASNTASPLPPNQVDSSVFMKATSSPQLGEILVDGAGYTLYRYDKDVAKPKPQSNCNEDCVMKWPPLIDTGNLKIEGVDQALVGSIVRSDFERQVTVAGWPVYRFSGDTAPGDAKGHGAGNVWYAVTPQGKKAAGAPANNGGGNATPPPGGGNN
jgi:predicted lipoprotein with Yx(FWY)xxD motif